MNCIADVVRAIEESGLEKGAVAREAGLEARYLYQIRTGRRRLTPRTLHRLELALAELKRQRKLTEQQKAQQQALRKGERAEPWKSRSAAQYRIAVVTVAAIAGVTARFILDAEPAKRATADPQWLLAARLRRIALYIANQYLFVQQADLARAASMSKANVCVALKAIEEMRDQDAELERMLSQVEEAFR